MATNTIRVDLIGVDKSMSKTLGSAGARALATGKAFEKAGRAMTLGMTVPLVAVGVATTKLALDYESSMTKIRALTGASTQQTEAWSKDILEWAGVVGKAPQELAEGLYFISSSGLQGAAAMDALKRSSIGAAVGLGETQTLADYATSAIGAYGGKIMSTTKALDILAAAVKVGKGESEDFSGALGNITGTAAALKVPLGEVVGSISAMTLKGLDVDNATTALNNMMTTTIKGAKQGSDALDKYGISYKQVRESFAKKGVLETLEMLNEAFHGNVEEMGKVFGNVRSMRAVMQLLSGDYEQTKAVIDEVRNSQGALNEAWAKTQGDPTLRLHQSLAQLQSAGIGIGSNLIPIVVQLAGYVGAASDGFAGLSDSTQALAVKAGIMAAALGPATWMLGKTVTVGTQAIGVSMTLGRTVGALSAAFRVGGIASFTSALGAALGPGGIAIAAIAGTAALVYGLHKLSKAFDDTAASAEDLQTAMEAVEGPKAQLIQEWADRELGGHFTVNGGELEWHPAIDVSPEPDVGDSIQKVIDDAKAAFRTAVDEITREQELATARVRKAQVAAELEAAQARNRTASGEEIIPGGSPLVKQKMAELAAISAKVDELERKNILIDVKADIKGYRAGIAGIDRDLARLRKIKNPGPKISAQIGDLLAKRAEIERKLKETQSKNRTILIQAKIDTAEENVSRMKKRLREIGDHPTSAKLKVEKKELEAGVKAEERRLKKLHNQLTKPKVGIEDNATRPILNIISTLDRIPDHKTVTIYTNRVGSPDDTNARGSVGIAREAVSSIWGEAGPEVGAFFPLTDIARSRSLYQQLLMTLPQAITRGGGSTTSVGASVTPRVVAAAPAGAGATYIDMSGSTYIGAPPEDWEDFVRSHAADVMDIGLAADSYSGRARGRGSG